MKLSSILVLSLGMTLAAAAAAAGETSARYRVTFDRTWSATTHPDDFPLLAHFSPVIGATHGDAYALFKEGATATPGIEKLCEEGKHQPLDSEIQAAKTAGSVGALIETAEPIRSVPGQAVTEFVIDSAHPMVSIAAMIAPSPDWCAVAANVSLMDGGAFVSEKSVDLYAWDAGTDSAASYRALDADMQPRGPESPNHAPYFERNGAPVPVGRVTFAKLQ